MRENNPILIIVKFTILLSFLLTNLLDAQPINQEDSLRIILRVDSAHELVGDHHKNAVSLIRELLEEARTTKSIYLISKSLYTSAYADWFNGDHSSALQKSRESLSYAILQKDKAVIAKNYSLIGLIYLYTSDYDSSLVNFDKALSQYIFLKDTARIIKNYGFEGLVYNKQGDYIKSKEILLETVLIKRNFSAQNWRVINIEESEEISNKYYQESLINAKKDLLNLGPSPEKTKKLRQTYLNLGLAYLRLNYGDSALVNFNKSADVSRALGIDVLWLETARAYKKLQLYDSAIVFNQRAIEVSLSRGTRITLSMAYNQMGEAYKGKGEFKKAKTSYKRALALHTFMGHKNAQMNILMNISHAAINLGLLDEALLNADSSFSIAQEIGSRYGRVEALQNIYIINKLRGDYKKALEVKLVHDVLLDSLQKGKVLLDLAKLDLYNEVELNKLEISDLNKQHELSKANLKNRTLVVTIISIVAIFIILLLIFNFFRTRKLRSFNDELNNQQEIISLQNKELIESNKEKALLLGEIHHRVKNNLQTITSLLNIQQRKLKDPESIKVLEDSKNRVMAMALIHQHLYQNASFAEIDFKNYTKQLVKVLIDTNACCEIDVKCSIPDLKIELDNAIFFGLIINELAINSIKHAYDNVKNPLLEISIFEDGDKMALCVKDNGQETDIDFEKSNSFGWKMVNNICEKLGGEIIVNSSNGLLVKILFGKDLISLN